MTALVAMEANHYEREHSSDKKSKEDTFLVATTPQHVNGGMDDRVNLLTEGRFLPGAINWKAAARMSPKTQPVFSKLDLSHLGVTIHSEKAIRVMHDRTSTSIKLEQFSKSNLSKSPADNVKTLTVVGSKIMESSDLVAFSGVRDALEAVHTWSLIATFLHPQDIGPEAVFRLLFIKFLDKALELASCKSYWKKVQADNAHRAERGETPYSYPELATVWNVGDYNLVTVPAKSQPVGGETSLASFSSAINMLSQKIEAFAPKAGRTGGASGPPAKKKKQESSKAVVQKALKLPYCHQFNKVAGCHRAMIGGKDKLCHDGDYGTIRKHACSHMDDGSVCGSSGHGASSHT